MYWSTDENDIFDSDFDETSSESEVEEGKEAGPEKQLRRAEKAARRVSHPSATTNDIEVRFD